MESARPHWSYSAISQYLRCPLQFYFRRILKLPEPSVSSGLILGSAVHHALAVYHQSLKDRRAVTHGEVLQAFLDHWIEREKSTVIEFKAGDNRDDLIDQGKSLLNLYIGQEPPQNIIAVEQRMLIPLFTSEGEFLETPLVAIADLITREPDGLKVQEFKTSGRSYGEFEVETSLQATCYAHAVHELSGEWATIEYAVLVKTKTPRLQRIRTNRTEEDVERLGDLVENIEQAVNSQIFYPVESPLNCSGCPYRQPCREWRPDRNLCRSEAQLVELNGATTC